jgi:large subunit ribosomal protein L19e
LSRAAQFGQSNLREAQEVEQLRNGLSGRFMARAQAQRSKKEVYVVKTRSLRYHLKVIKERKDITNDMYWHLYKKVNGGQVRSLAHLRELVKEAKSS